MKRILTWHYEGIKAANDRVGPAYYIEADYAPTAVRIHAETAPDVDDATFDILDDGVTIMASGTSVVLPLEQTEEEMAENFKEGLNIEKGSWLTCTLGKDGGGKNFTVQLEMEEVSSEDEPEE